MDKVEQYLDRVCRGIAGPRSLRQHIRQELAEHLRDAAAVHRSAGLSEDEALTKALEDFGGPEQVRTELEATHGHHLLTLVVDKALQWKETTMKARWFWVIGAHKMVLLAILLPLAFLYGCIIFIVPKFREISAEGWIWPSGNAGSDSIMQWCLGVVEWSIGIMQFQLWIWIILAALWALFERRMRSEDKIFMRLSGLGTLAVALSVWAFMLAVAMILSLVIAITPEYHARQAHAIALAQVRMMDDVLASPEVSLADGNWRPAMDCLQSIDRFVRYARGTDGMPLLETDAEVSEQKSAVQSLDDALRDLRTACINCNPEKYAQAMRTFRQTYAALHPTTRPK